MEIMLKDNDTGVVCSGVIRQIEMCEEKKYMQLQKEIVDGLKNKDVFVCMTNEEYKAFLTKYKAVPLGLYVDDKMYGAWFTVAYGGNEGCLSKDIGLVPQEYKFNCNYETAILHPKFRGQGLNTVMSKKMTESLLAAGFKYLSATVEPTNFPSMGSILKDNYVIVDRKIKYGGFDRYIFCKNLESPILLSNKDIIYIDALDIDEIEKNLHNGYVGVEISNNKDTITMKLKRRLD